MKPGDMMLIVGKTGSGKSVEALERVKQFHVKYPSVGIIIVNPKPVKTEWDKLIKPCFKKPRWGAGKLINWKVRPWEDDQLNDFLWDVYNTGKPCLVVFDEGQDIKDYKFPSAAALWRQGREMEISVLTCTQRPVGMSRYAISQAKWISIYNIIGEDDLKALDSYMEVPLLHYIAPSKVKNGLLIEGKRLKKFHHLFYDVTNGTAEIQNPVEITEHSPLIPAKKPLPVGKITISILALLALKVIV